MGRTLHYAVFGHDEIPDDIRNEIDLAQHMLNHHFSWSSESLALRLFDEPATKHADPLDRHDPRTPLLGAGFTKVYDDEWNAHLVTTFIAWVSSRLPDAIVKLHDEGDYVLAGYLRFIRGVPSVDKGNLVLRREWFSSNGYEHLIPALDEGEQQGERRVFFKRVSAFPYMDRPEFRFHDRLELAEAYLDRVSDDLVMPWQTEWLSPGLHG